MCSASYSNTLALDCSLSPFIPGNKTCYTCLHVNCRVQCLNRMCILPPGSVMLSTEDCLDITPDGPRSFCLASSAVRTQQTTTYLPSRSSLDPMTAHWKVPFTDTSRHSILKGPVLCKIHCIYVF